MRHLRRLKSLVATLALAMLSASFVPIFSQPALAQATTGSIGGTVNDQTGAVVPNAIVVAKNQATGVETPQFKTTNEGIYFIPNLNPGTYTVTVESPNFKRAVYTDITVKLGETTGESETGIVDQQIDRLAVPNDIRHQRAGRARLAEVELNRAGVAQLGRQLVQPFLATRHQHQPVAPGRQLPRELDSQAGRGPGDEGDRLGHSGNRCFLDPAGLG